MADQVYGFVELLELSNEPSGVVVLGGAKAVRSRTTESRESECATVSSSNSARTLFQMRADVSRTP